MKELWSTWKTKLLNREVISYLIAGVLTTLVNIVSFYLIRRYLLVERLWANGTAFFISVLFAYVVNNKYVFIQEKGGRKQELTKLVNFFTARLFTLLVDQAGMWFFAEQLGVQEMLTKIGMNGIIIVLNYVLSKWFIFHKK